MIAPVLQAVVSVAVALTAQACTRAGAPAAEAPATEAAMTSPRLPEAPELAGRWIISQGDVACEVVLRPEAIAPANGHGLSAEPGCLERLGLGEATAWRPATDGLQLARADGFTLAFLSHDGSGGFEGLPGAQVLRVRRAAD